MSLHARSQLPPEVIEVIAHHAAFEHPPTLWNLAGCSRTYYACCRMSIESMLYHDVSLSIPYLDAKHIENEVSILAKKLEVTKSHRYVRRLLIIGKCSGHDECPSLENRTWSPPRISDLRREQPANKFTAQFDHLLEGPPCGKEPFWSKSFPDPPFDIDNEAMWSPLVNLIKQLPALNDLVWREHEKLPLPILNTLHRDIPRCRLHLESLWLRSDFFPDTYTRELEILGSPSLYSVKIQAPLGTGRNVSSLLYDSWISAGLSPAERQRESVSILLRSAPNLKKVRLEGWSEIFKLPLSQQGDVPLRLASLKTFDAFLYGEQINHGVVNGLSHYIDFSSLRDLNLSRAHSTELFGMVHLSFPKLETLSLNLRKESQSLDMVDFYAIVTRFLQSLPPLIEIELIRWHSLVSIESVVKHHGSHLQKLKIIDPLLLQTFNKQDIDLIGQNCPHLQDLAITINRTQGDSREVSLYKLLGSIKNLKYLKLNFEPFPAIQSSGLPSREEVINSENLLSFLGHDLPAESFFDEFDNQYYPHYLGYPFKIRNGHMRRLIIDSIIDETLSSAIFQRICSAKAPGCPLLEDLTIKINRIGAQEMHWMVSDIDGSWRVQRKLRDFGCERLSIEQSKPWENYPHFKPWSERRKDFHLDEGLSVIFHELFPGAKPKKTTAEGFKEVRKEESKGEAGASRDLVASCT